jgi:hypothetical protein
MILYYKYILNGKIGERVDKVEAVDKIVPMVFLRVTSS